MAFKATSTNSSTNLAGLARGFTLVELMIATGVSSLLLLGLGSLSLYTSRHFAATANYVDLDTYSRLALDTVTRDLRQASRLQSITTTAISVIDADGAAISFTFDPVAQTLTKVKDGVSKVLLRDCESLSFTSYQRNSISGTYDQYPAADAATCKLISIRWVCARRVLGSIRNSESIQTAKVVIRKQ